MEEDLLNKAIEKYRLGISIRQIAKDLNISFSTVKYYLIKHRIHNPTKKFNINGLVICKKCFIEKPISEFSRYNNHADRTCNLCIQNYQTEYCMKKFGLSIEEYNKLHDSQNGKCGICRTSVGHRTKYGKEARLAIDHCHDTGKIRGLLCSKCNRGLGYLKNNLQSAIDYLNKTVD